MVPYETIPAINAFEKSVLESAIAAQEEYKAMTNGWWLWHGPESFLQVVVAQGVAKTAGNVVYIDTSMERMVTERGRGPGRPAANSRQRPDISVWNKASETLRAIIEIKRTVSLGPILADAAKMNRWLRQANSPGAAYILAYSEASGGKRTATMKKRFNNWQTKSGWRKVGWVVHDDPDDPMWAWGIVLLRNPAV
jgi:hypothetical protein